MKLLLTSLALLFKLLKLAEAGQEPKVIQGLLRRIYAEKAQPLRNGGCRFNEYVRCPNGGKCIHRGSLCNGLNECLDPERSDERPENCYSEPGLFHRCSIPRNEDDFQCTNGACLHSSLTCDGHKDCSDGSDESPSWCPSGTVCELTASQELEADIRRKGDSFPFCLYKCRKTANATSHSLQMAPMEYLRQVQNGSNDSFSESTLNSVCGIPELTACETACAQNDCERDLVNSRQRLWKLSFGMAWDWLCVRPPSTVKEATTGCDGFEGSVPDCRSEAGETISSVCQKCEREEEEDVDCVVGVCRLLCEAQVLKERCPSENPDAVGFRARFLLHAWQHSNLTVYSF